MVVPNSNNTRSGASHDQRPIAASQLASAAKWRYVEGASATPTFSVYAFKAAHTPSAEFYLRVVGRQVEFTHV